LRGDHADTAAAAVALLVDLTTEMAGLDYFHSEDPVEAARFVVSDVVEVLWRRMRELHGSTGFLPGATAQLIRWETPHGWSRRGEGWVAEHERPLADVLAGLLTVPDLWVAAARCYLDALDRTEVATPPSGSRAHVPTTDWAARRRTAALSRWHQWLIDQLGEPEEAPLLDRIATHRAFAEFPTRRPVPHPAPPPLAQS